MRYLSQYGTAIRMGLAALVIAGTADLFAGLFLDSMENYLLVITGMMVLIYSAIGMRGNIFGAMGSRIGTAMNIGTFEMSLRRGTVLRANVDSCVALTLVMSIAIGAATWAVATLFFGGSADLAQLVFISALGGFLAGLVVMMFNILIAYVGSKREWDVDNITAPLIAAIGDIVTIPMIHLSCWLFFRMDELEIGGALVDVLAAAMCVITAAYSARVLRKGASRRDFSSEGRRIFVQSLPVLLICLIFEIGAGIVIQDEQDSLIEYSVLMIMIPAFLNQGNALSGMLTSRLSSRIHLGTLRTRLNPVGALDDFLMIMICALITFLYIGIVSYAACVAVNGGSNIPFATSIEVIMIAGFLATIILSILSYYVAMAAAKFGLDPDDHSIPITSSVMDLLGSMVFVTVIGFFI